jgi:hypothetical protein
MPILDARIGDLRQPVLEGLRNVRKGHVPFCCQIGDRPCHPGSLPDPPAGKDHPIGRSYEERARLRGEGRDHLGIGDACRPVRPEGVSREAAGLHAAGRRDASADGDRFLPAGRCGPVVPGKGGDGDRQVEPVEKRPGEFLREAEEDGRGASTDPFRMTGASARAQVRRREEQETAGEPVDVARSGDTDFPGFEGLAERFPGFPPELGELVQEKHPAVGEGDLSGAGRISATYQSCGSRGVMGGAKRASRDEARPGGLPRGAVDLRRFERLVLLEIGQDSRDPLNLIFPVYFDLMRQFSPISPEGSLEIYLHWFKHLGA